MTRSFQFMQDYNENYLLDKRVIVFQPINGYHASTDAIILSSLIKHLKKGENILDVGSGTGAISLCLAHRFSTLKPQITGMELQSDLAELSNQSATANGFQDFLHYINCNIKNKPKDIENCSFAHVITNPPYATEDMPSPNTSKALAHNHHDFSLTLWIQFCIKMLRPKGYFYIINRAEAIDEILSAITGKLGRIQVIPLFSKPQQNAKRVMIIAQKDNHAATQILPGLTVHKEDGNYTDIAHNILRQGKSFFDQD